MVIVASGTARGHVRTTTTTTTESRKMSAILQLKCWQRHISLIYSGAPAARRAAKRNPILIKERKGNPWVDFLMVITASGIARGHVRTTATSTTTESRNMAAILQIKGWQRHAALIYRVLLWNWTFMLWSIDTCQNKVSADQYHVTILRAQIYNSSRLRVFLKLTADQVLVFDWIAGSSQVNLLKTVQDCSEAGYR